MGFQLELDEHEEERSRILRDKHKLNHKAIYLLGMKLAEKMFNDGDINEEKE